MLRNKPTRQPTESLYEFASHTIPEAALALGMDPWTLRSWYSKSQPILTPSAWYGDESHIALLSFRDIEEAYKLHLLRTKHGLTMQYLERALREARKESDSEHPLIECKLMVFEYLALEKPAKGRSSRKTLPLGFSGQKSQLIPEVVDTWGRRIVANSHGRTVRIFPWREAKTDDSSRPVSIDPEVMSGRAVITGTRIPIKVIKKRSVDGDSPEQIADAYGIDRDLVAQALIHLDQETQRAVRTLS